MKRLRLKDCAIPRVFQSFSKYLSIDRILFRRTVSSTSTLRHYADYRHQLQKNEDLIGDEFRDLTSLNRSNHTIYCNSTNWLLHLLKTRLHRILHAQWIDTGLIAPKMGVCLTISKALELLVYVYDAQLLKIVMGMF